MLFILNQMSLSKGVSPFVLEALEVSYFFVKHPFVFISVDRTVDTVTLSRVSVI